MLWRLKMNREKKESSVFPVRAVRISLLLALLLFVTGACVLVNLHRINAASAIILAQHGYYDSADSRLNLLDLTEDGDLYYDTRYRVAETMMKREDYDAAYEKFLWLGDYSDSKDKAYACLQKKAAALMAQGSYREASAILQDILFWEDSQQLYRECQYRYAMKLIDDGDWRTGVGILWSIRDYQDAALLAKSTVRNNLGTDDVESSLGIEASLSAEETQAYVKLMEQRSRLKDGCWAVGFRHTVGLTDDGRVMTCGSNAYGQCDTQGWKNAVQIAAGAYHTVALLSDGTVTACGDNQYGQCDVSEWKDVMQIVATDYNTAALLQDGTVVTCGYNQFVTVKGWNGIVKLCAGEYSLSGLNMSGELVSTHLSNQMAEKLMDADMSTSYAIGLTYTGDVVATTDLPAEWKKAVSVYAGGNCAAVITEDDKAMVFDRRKGDWVDLPQEKQALTVALGGTHVAVLYDDGSVYCAGRNDEGQCNTDPWNLF